MGWCCQLRKERMSNLQRAMWRVSAVHQCGSAFWPWLHVFSGFRACASRQTMNLRNPAVHSLPCLCGSALQGADVVAAVLPALLTPGGLMHCADSIVLQVEAIDPCLPLQTCAAWTPLQQASAAGQGAGTSARHHAKRKRQQGRLSLRHQQAHEGLWAARNGREWRQVGAAGERRPIWPLCRELPQIFPAATIPFTSTNWVEPSGFARSRSAARYSANRLGPRPRCRFHRSRSALSRTRVDRP